MMNPAGGVPAAIPPLQLRIREGESTLNQLHVLRFCALGVCLAAIALIVANGVGLSNGRLTSLQLGSINIGATFTATVLGCIAGSLINNDMTKKVWIISAIGIFILLGTYFTMNVLGILGKFSSLTLGLLTYATPTVFLWTGLLGLAIAGQVEIADRFKRVRADLTEARRELGEAQQQAVDQAAENARQAAENARQAAEVQRLLNPMYIELASTLKGLLWYTHTHIDRNSQDYRDKLNEVNVASNRLLGSFGQEALNYVREEFRIASEGVPRP